MDENENLNILNMMVLSNGSIWSIKVGSIERQTTGEIKLIIDQEAIMWPTWYKQVRELRFCNASLSVEYYTLNNHNAFFNDSFVL